ncbi:MAG: [citrate (pro-3S)-lyase] ligase [Oscillospiraceae bacterium]|nr:[citrate (pro-3S)-lyase] ligase [Oscillospiraceae bacterium]
MQYGYTEQLASPLRGKALEELKALLAKTGLTYAPGIQHTALVRDPDGAVIAAASLEDNVIKCVACDPAHQGEDLTASVLTALRRKALEEGRRHLFLYTKPENAVLFSGLGFHEVARAGEAALMEDRRDGFVSWAESLRVPAAGGKTGALVMNCNPMTLGHRYLVEKAAAQCDFLYVLIVSEDKSIVPAADRLALVRASLEGMSGVVVAETGEYLISSATFPDYFLKDKSRSGQVWTELDAAVFCRLAQRLGIACRFVGSEPFCPVTAAYNRTLAQVLPRHGVELAELPRLERDGTAISATAVRALVKEGRWEDIRPLVPPAVYDWFSNTDNRSRFLKRSAQISG